MAGFAESGEDRARMPLGQRRQAKDGDQGKREAEGVGNQDRGRDLLAQHPANPQGHRHEADRAPHPHVPVGDPGALANRHSVAVKQGCDRHGGKGEQADQDHDRAEPGHLGGGEGEQGGQREGHPQQRPVQGAGIGNRAPKRPGERHPEGGQGSQHAYHDPAEAQVAVVERGERRERKEPGEVPEVAGPQAQDSVSPHPRFGFRGSTRSDFRRLGFVPSGMRPEGRRVMSPGRGSRA